MAKVRVTWERHFQYQPFDGEKVTLSVEEEINTPALKAKPSKKDLEDRAVLLGTVQNALFDLMASLGDEIVQGRLAVVSSAKAPKQEMKDPGTPVEATVPDGAQEEKAEESAEDLPW